MEYKSVSPLGMCPDCDYNGGFCVISKLKTHNPYITLISYYLDLGMYFLIVREDNYDEYMEIVQDFQLLIPEDLSSDYLKYELDLRNIPSDLVICSCCNSIFPKSHPVYSQYNICPDCATKQ